MFNQLSTIGIKNIGVAKHNLITPKPIICLGMRVNKTYVVPREKSGMYFYDVPNVIFTGNEFLENWSTEKALLNLNKALNLKTADNATIYINASANIVVNKEQTGVRYFRPYVKAQDNPESDLYTQLGFASADETNTDSKNRINLPIVTSFKPEALDDVPLSLAAMFNLKEGDRIEGFGFNVVIQ